MAILTKDAFMQKIKEIIGDNNDDSSLSFIEDMTDTYNSMESLSSDNANWKQKYEENDANWRKTYRDRFFGGKGKEDEEDDSDDNEGKGKTAKKKTFEELFTIGKKGE